MKKTYNRFLFSFLYSLISIFYFSLIPLSSAPPAEFKDRMNFYFDDILERLPAVLLKIPPEMRRVALYNFKTASPEITDDLLKLMRSKLESKIVSSAVHKIVFVPELKPLKILMREDEFSVKSSINTTEEMREIGQKMKLDGIINCEINTTPKSLNLFIQVIDIETSRVVAGEILSAGADYVSKSVQERGKAKLTATYSFGLQNFNITTVSLPAVSTATASSAAAIPASCTQYSNELFFTEVVNQDNKVRFGAGVGLLYLASGISGQTVNMFAGSASGTGFSGLYLKAGAFFRMLPNPHNKSRNLLELFLGFDRIFTFNIPDLNVLNYGFNAELSERFGLSFYGNYVLPVEATLKNGTKIKIENIGMNFQFVKIKF